MKIEDFDYYLPESLIAQSPVNPRDHSKLMVIHKETGEIEHRIFYNIIDYLNKDDLLILNETKVIRARLIGKKETGANVEVFLLKKVDDKRWQTLVRPGGKIKEGTKIIFNGAEGICVKHLSDGTRYFEFNVGDEELERIGEIPLPPYIKKPLEDPSRYQTVYAKDPGSVAAPTAGLHFTDRLLDEISAKGVKILKVTLDVGLDTFRPIHEKEIEDHKMHTENYRIPEEVIEEIKHKKGRVIAVGTTVVRTLESWAKTGQLHGDTSLYIYPPYKFKVVEGLITNFHLPKSSLIVLVSAFAGRELVMKAYKMAVENGYRFFSFGDACLFI
ncbi:tRNA preQ1(34) S-adenosylmethionine ribosyltransferase-isomerase QueA [Athalassotoga saccharophila]|uniref:tRNA preQ1(34) S-adenosylmethionine ribosyltransferase-isomerase QueA n=1 Tax=Athalassotoga saccharophila TaxID=1441386 RepID=UPI00137B004C|nr:tRNA preQ1(34) S-adenosylmethionine ribosyltransferase-isomerase QueA [Athalassotoga saccharophila]BBJ28945.1 S-adenosylmethionine:tRNA ribosyltransferase-isomerase [Athalassotoga saccharophila]